MCWSFRADEPAAVVGSLIGVVTHAAVAWRAEGRRRRVLFVVPLFAFPALAPLPVVEACTSALALAVLFPHLRSALVVPEEVSPGRWLLEAGEELLWGLWAISVAAPLVAAPNVVYVPVSVLIAWKAWRGARRRRGSTATGAAAWTRFTEPVEVAVKPTPVRQWWGFRGAPPPLYA